MKDFAITGAISSAELFSPDNPGDVNARALQSLCDKRGTVRIERPGVYELDRTVFLSSDTELIFGAGVYIKRVPCSDPGVISSYVFVNRGAFTRVFDHDITIRGLRLSCNGIEARPNVPIVGLIAHLSFFYVNRLRIYALECLDLLPGSFCIQVCTFEDCVIEDVRIEGRKDAIHFGRGSKFVVRHGLFRTFDDPIALNAHDYATSNPQLGWIRDGLIEDCYDLADRDTTGFFARILAGSWCDWEPGMKIRHSDTVVSEGRLYRAANSPDGTEYASYKRPSHQSGTVTLDGINWVMVQDDEPIYNCGCENIVFRGIYLQKKRGAALSIHFDDDRWSHSYYPNSPAPVQRNLTFDNVCCSGEIDCLITSRTAVDCVRLINSSLGDSRIDLSELPYREINYPETKLIVSGASFGGDSSDGAAEREFLRCSPKRAASLNVSSSFARDGALRTVFGDVKLSGDADFIKKA